MDRKIVVHIHNGILLSYNKECIWGSSNEVDEPGAYSTVWSKSEGERQMLYIDTHTHTHTYIYIYGNYKDGTNDPICRAAEETKM